jgi:hypothetical protein
MLGLDYLVMGAAYGCLGRSAEAVKNFRLCLSSRAELPKSTSQGDEGIGDHHIAAFATYELAVLLCMQPEVGTQFIFAIFFGFTCVS